MSKVDGNSMNVLVLHKSLNRRYLIKLFIFKKKYLQYRPI